jgi:hypothetical protein
MVKYDIRLDLISMDEILSSDYLAFDVIEKKRYLTTNYKYTLYQE